MTFVTSVVFRGIIGVIVGAEVWIDAGRLFVESNIIALDFVVTIFAWVSRVFETFLNDETVRDAVWIGETIGLSGRTDENIIVIKVSPSAVFLIIGSVLLVSVA